MPAQLQQNQHVLQAVANTQVSTAPPAHLSPQQQQQYQYQQQQAQLLQQHLKQLNPATNAIQTVAINKPQVVNIHSYIVNEPGFKTICMC